MGNDPIRGGILVLFVPVFPSNVELCRKISNFCLPFFGKNILRILSDYGTFYLTDSVCVTVKMPALQRREFTFMEANRITVGSGRQRGVPASIYRDAPGRAGPAGGGRNRGRLGPAGPAADAAPDVVVMEIVLGGIDGIEVLERLSQMELDYRPRF